MARENGKGRHLLHPRALAPGGGAPKRVIAAGHDCLDTISGSTLPHLDLLHMLRYVSRYADDWLGTPRHLLTRRDRQAHTDTSHRE